jgi:hypothetical protein
LHDQPGGLLHVEEILLGLKPHRAGYATVECGQ